VQGHLGAPELSVKYGVSPLVWEQRWQECFGARPGVTIPKEGRYEDVDTTVPRVSLDGK